MPGDVKLPLPGRVFLDGYIEVPPDRLAAVTRALPDHIALTRAEPGCLAFSVTPSSDHPDRFLVSEIFADQAAFDAHQRRAKASAWAEVTAGLPRRYTIRTEP
jgi:quinol monooxygenase YgiN